MDLALLMVTMMNMILMGMLARNDITMADRSEMIIMNQRTATHMKNGSLPVACLQGVGGCQGDLQIIMKERKIMEITAGGQPCEALLLRGGEVVLLGEEVLCCLGQRSGSTRGIGRRIMVTRWKTSLHG